MEHKSMAEFTPKLKGKLSERIYSCLSKEQR